MRKCSNDFIEECENVSKLMTVEEALDLVQDGMTFSFSGFVACALPEALLTGLEERFLKTGSPKDLFHAGHYGAGAGGRL